MAIDIDSGEGVHWGASTLVNNAALLSISCWFNPDNITQDHTLVSNWNGSSAGIMLFGDDSGGGYTDTMGFLVISSGDLLHGGSSNYTTGTWLHVLVTFSGTAHADQMRMYLDGAEVGDSPYTHGVTDLGSSATDLCMGVQNAGGTRPAIAQFGHVAVWSSVLSAADAVALAAGADPRLISPNTLGLLADNYDINSANDVVGGIAKTDISTPGTAVSPHRKVIHPTAQIIPFAPAAGAAAGGVARRINSGLVRTA